MASSTLDPDNVPRGKKARQTAKGHDVKSLGPSDSSDSGSDMAGPGLIDADMMHLDRGTTEDMPAGDADIADAGPSVGDIGMDEDSHRDGTGTGMSAELHPGAGDGA